MKNIKFKKRILLICLMFAFGTLQNLNAQPGFGSGVDDETQPAPIDGFIGIALAVGAYFGSKKLRNKKE